MGKKQDHQTADPKTTALTHLGICYGSKNLKCLKKEEVDEAFITQFIASGGLTEATLPSGGKLGSKKQYQRILHESYQFLVKFIADQQAIDNSKKGKKK